MPVFSSQIYLLEQPSLYTKLGMVSSGKGPSPLIKIIKNLLEDETDEFTTIALPLIARENLQLRIDLDGMILGGEPQSQSPVLESARLGFDAIAVHAAPHLRGSKLQILRYIVLFSCLVIYLHLINRNREVNLAADGRTEYSFVPILVDFSNAGAPRIRYASQSTYRTAIKQIENLVLSGFKTYLSKEYPNLDEQTAEEVLSRIEWRPSKKGKPDQSQNSNLFKGMYNAYRVKGTPILEALSAAMTDMFYKERIAPPDDFARSLGIRAGFVGPAANRAVEKYYTITPDLLEVLVLSVTNPEEDVQETVVLTELAKRLRERYGVLTGALPDDYDYLSREGIQDADHDDLEQNAFAFQQVLVAIGKAREYADGVAVVQASIGELL